MDAVGNDVCGHFGGLTKTIQKEKNSSRKQHQVKYTQED